MNKAMEQVEKLVEMYGMDENALSKNVGKRELFDLVEQIYGAGKFVYDRSSKVLMADMLLKMYRSVQRAKVFAKMES